jgi:tetratricopeptide (TPR) repeat protein/GTP-binding protein EngB required for normal cell division
MGILDRIAGTLDELAGEGDTGAREEIGLAVAMAERGDLQGAEARLADITARLPKLAPAFFHLGRVRARRGALEEAVTALGKAVDLNRDVPDAWAELGDALARLGRTEPARDALRHALALPASAELRGRAHAALGRVHAEAGQLAKAVRDFRKALELVGDDGEVALAYGRALAKLGEPEGDEWLTRAARRPGAPPGLFAEAAAATNDAPLAEALLREGLSRAPGDGALQAALARHLARAGRPDEALTLALTSVGANPSSPQALAALREAYAATARWREALAVAEREAEVGAPPPPETRLALALAAHDRDALARLATLAEGAGARPNAGPPSAFPAPPVAASPSAFPAQPDASTPVAFPPQPVAGTPGAFPPQPVAGTPGAFPPQPVASTPGAFPTQPVAGTPGAFPARALRAFLAGAAGDEDLVALARLAPDEDARRFVVAAAAPLPPPGASLVGLLDWTHAFAARTPALVALAPAAGRALEAYDRPLLVAVMGEFNAGKSSFVNALVGEEVAPTGVTPTTATVNVLRHGEKAGGRVMYHDGTTRELGAASVSPFLRELSDEQAAGVRVVEIFHPLEALGRVEIVDTPGLNSIRPEHEKVAREFLVEADALVWVFAIGQAAKASEKEALELAHAAGKHVLGVLNKTDGASDDEVRAVVRHVQSGVGPLVDDVVPFSATRALAARRAGAADAPTVALEAALERRFFGRARALKRATALAALERFIAAARAAAPEAAAPDFAARRTAIDALDERLRGTLAHERVALRARIDEAYRVAAFEVRDFVRPRAWRFGAHRADSADEPFLVELLEDAALRATEATRAALRAAIAPAESASPAAAPPAEAREAAARAIDAAVARFDAYAQGVVAGGAVAEFFRSDLPRIELDASAIRSALARRAPDPEHALFASLGRDLAEVVRRAHVAVDAEETDAAIRRLLRDEHLERPLAALERALAELGAPEPADVGVPGPGAALEGRDQQR